MSCSGLLTTTTRTTPDNAVVTLTPYIAAYEKLDKWKNCRPANDNDDEDIQRRLVVPSSVAVHHQLVHLHNWSRANGNGFPTVATIGTQTFGLSEHEVSAIFGWTTGDYRFVNPIARGLEFCDFDEYPLLPNQIDKVRFRLTKEDVLPYVMILNRALHKLPAMDDPHAILWRGHGRPIPSTIAGSTFVLPGFTSVSRDREVALSFVESSLSSSATIGKSPKKIRVLLAIVAHQNSKCLTKLSARKHEMEVLFPLDTMFQVLDPPLDDRVVVVQDDTMRAAKMAEERLFKIMPDASIDVVYVKEVETTDWS